MTLNTPRHWESKDCVPVQVFIKREASNHKTEQPRTREAPIAVATGEPRTEALKTRDLLMPWEFAIRPDLLGQWTGMVLWRGMPYKMSV